MRRGGGVAGGARRAGDGKGAPARERHAGGGAGGAEQGAERHAGREPHDGLGREARRRAARAVEPVQAAALEGEEPRGRRGGRQREDHRRGHVQRGTQRHAEDRQHHAGGAADAQHAAAQHVGQRRRERAARAEARGRHVHDEVQRQEGGEVGERGGREQARRNQ
ncbi:MAG: hypothetical protein ACXVFT_05905 [Solirubrobacteraceae bacterium]